METFNSEHRLNKYKKKVMEILIYIYKKQRKYIYIRV